MSKNVFVTGGTRNSGWAIARRFAADGWNVVIASRDAASAADAAAKLKEEFPSVETMGVRMDPAKVPEIRAAFAEVKARFGVLHAFVACAGHLGVGLSILSTTEEDWNAVMDCNARGTFFGAQEAMKLMTEGGAMAFVSSVHQLRAVPGRVCYTASKAAIGGLVRALAVELGCKGIRVNSVLAGAIRTDRWDGLSESDIAKRRERWPVGRESTPDDIATAVHFLCSDAAATITGAELPVDGGLGACLLQYNKDWMTNDPYNVKYWKVEKLRS